MSCTRGVYEIKQALSTEDMNKVTLENHENKCQFMPISRYIVRVSLK